MPAESCVIVETFFGLKLLVGSRRNTSIQSIILVSLLSHNWLGPEFEDSCFCDIMTGPKTLPIYASKMPIIAIYLLHLTKKYLASIV